MAGYLLNETDSRDFSMNTDDVFADYMIHITVLQMLVTLVTIIANGLVIIVYLRDRKLRNATNFFLLNLVFADFLVGICLPIHAATFHLPKEMMTPSLCLMRFFVLGTPLTSSVLSLLLITIERFLAVLNPFHHKKYLNKMMRYSLAVSMWTLSILLMIVLPLTWEVNVENGCMMIDAIIPRYFWRFIVLPISFLVYTLMISMYIKIFKVAHMQMQSIELLVVQVSPGDRKKIRNVKLAKTGFIVLGIFLICSVPFTILCVVNEAGVNGGRAMKFLCPIAFAFTVFISAINPFIYSTRIHRFKVQIKKLLNLQLRTSDMYDQYKIRQKFKVRKSAAIDGDIGYNTVGKNAGTMNQSFEDGEELNNSSSEEHRLSRCLSRISESPECRTDYMYSPAHSDVAESISDTFPDSNQLTNIPNLRTASESHALDLAGYTDYSPIPADPKHAADTISSSKHKSLPDNNRLIDNLIMPEALTINCDSKTEFLTLVVERVMRTYSDTESESEENDDEEIQTSKQDKSHLKSRTRTFSDGQNPSDMASDTPTIPTGQTATAVKSNLLTPDGTYTDYQQTLVKRKIKHQRTASTVSAASILLENDEIHIELSTDQKSKKSSNINYMPSPMLSKPYNPSATLKSSSTCSQDQLSDKIDVKPKEQSTFKGFWEGTLGKISSLRRYRKTSGNDLTRSREDGDSLSAQQSKSTEDLTNKKLLRVVHQRSVSDTVENINYETSFYRHNIHKSALVKASDSTTFNSHIAESTSTSLKVESHEYRSLQSNHCQPNTDKQYKGQLSPRIHHQHRRQMSALSACDELHRGTEVILPIQLCLSSGEHKEIYLTKESIYSNNNLDIRDNGGHVQQQSKLQIKKERLKAVKSLE